jgi:hypothetical protein
VTIILGEYMSEVIMNQAYVPAEAEHGKFTVIDSSTLSAMGLTGSYGRYAILTYNIGSSITTPGASSNNPLSITQVKTNSINVSTVSFNNNITSITFEPPATFIEIYNNSNNKMYISYEPLTTVLDLTARGMPIGAQGYYSIEKNVTNLIAGSDLDISDARIFGHSIQ